MYFQFFVFVERKFTHHEDLKKSFVEPSSIIFFVKKFVERNSKIFINVERKFTHHKI